MNQDIYLIEKVENPDESLIPKGSYCYRHTGRKKLVHFFFDSEGKRKRLEKPIEMPEIQQCPYYRINPDKEEQNNAYCALLGRGDWDEDSFSLLWDSVKECGINDETED